MIQSMTGYGKTTLQLPTKKISIEVKSLNSKSIDLNVRIPSAYRAKELFVRKLIASELRRGKVDFFLHVETTGEEINTQLNKPVITAYINQLKTIVNDGDPTELLGMAIKMPEALSATQHEIDDNEWQDIEKQIHHTLTKINDYRTEEGLVLENDFVDRIQAITTILEQIIVMDPERIKGVRERLQKGILELKEKVDENRFEQELVYYIEKFDITEEHVRLKNHLTYFIKALNSSDSNGKKLGFISQEIGREINTIGSKSNYAPMQKLVVQMKDELEKIKEQLLNIL